jgi:lipopolysaccharide export system permease protein
MSRSGGGPDYPRFETRASKSAPPRPRSTRAVIFQRSLLREFGSYAAAVFSVLLAIVVTSQLVRLLSRAAGGKIPSDAILALIGFTAMNYLPILLALTVFVSVLMTVSRSYKDSEMVVWSAAGVSLLAWVRPVLVFAAPIILLSALLGLFLSPWTNDRAQEYRRKLDSREEVSRIAPGVFRESANSERVFFVEGVDGEEGRVRNVFIASAKRGKTGVTVSREGFIEATDDGDRYAVLLNGRSYDGILGTAEWSVVEFERYALRIKAREYESRGRWPKAVPTLELLRSQNREWRAELMWRIGLPLVALNLALLAIPLAFVNPRASRSVNLLFAVFAYMVYSNLLGIVQAWVAQGRVRFEIGWWVLHAAMFGLILFLFLWRSTLGFKLWRRR